MDFTPNLALPYLLPNQAQKHVTLNEALRLLDVLAQLTVTSKGLNDPPLDVADGACFIIGDTPVGAWVGQANNLAARQDGAWAFIVPTEGWLSYCQADQTLWLFQAAHWVSLSSLIASGIEVLSINAEADPVNRFTLSSSASLFNHEGGGHQLKINRESISDTASLVFQTDYTGSAEIGLIEQAGLSFKVAADGDNWVEALRIDGGTGRVTLPRTPQRELLLADRTYYVRIDGDDENDGLSDNPNSAVRTIQRAIDLAASIDMGVFSVTIQIGAGLYPGALELKRYVGAGPIRMVGNIADPSQVVLQSDSNCISGDGAIGRYELEGVRLDGVANCIFMNAGAFLEFSNVQFDGPGTHIHARSQGIVQARESGQYEITAAQFVRHAYANLPGASVTAFANQIIMPVAALIQSDFLQAKRASAINFGASAFTNGESATGKPYTAKENAVVILGSSIGNLPGDVAGEISSGGIIV